MRYSIQCYERGLPCQRLAFFLFVCLFVKGITRIQIRIKICFLSLTRNEETNRIGLGSTLEEEANFSSIDYVQIPREFQRIAEDLLKRISENLRKSWRIFGNFLITFEKVSKSSEESRENPLDNPKESFTKFGNLWEL